MSQTKWIECYYGQSGSGKSESIVAVIESIYKATGKIARVCIGDGSAASYAALQDAGVVELLDYTTREWPLTTMTQLCKGYWPEKPEDPKSKMQPMTPEQFAKIGVYVIEGLAVAAKYIMGDQKGGFAEQASRGVRIGGDNPVKIVDAELDAAGNPKPNSGPGTAFGGITLGGYGIAQKRVEGLIEHSKGLPGWVIWTSHERASEDKVTNQKVIGPEVAGGALTASLSRVFNNTLHFATAEKTQKTTDEHTQKQIDLIDSEFRIYTRDHFRPEGNTFVKYKAVVRHPDPSGEKFGAKGEKGKPSPDALPLYFESPIPGKSIIDFYEHVKRARERQQLALKAA